MSHGIRKIAQNIFSGLDKKLFFCVAGLAAFIFIESIFSPLKAVVAGGFFFLLFCSWHRPLWVIIVLAALLPFEPFLLKWIADDVYVIARYASEVAIYIVVGTALVKKMLSGKKMHLGAVALPLAGFATAALVSTIVNHTNFVVDIMGLRQLFRFILLYCAILLIWPSERWVKKLILVMFGIAVLESGIAFLQSGAGGSLDVFLLPAERRVVESIQLTAGTTLFWQEGQRVFATLGRYDQLGTFLCFFILLAIGLCYEIGQKALVRKLLAGSAIAAFALLLTYSRASWFGFLIGFFLIAIALKKDMRIAAGFLAAILIGFGMYATLGIMQQYRIDIADQTVFERFFEAFSPERIKGEYYALGRMYFMAKTPSAVAVHAPLIGVGPGRFGGGVATALHETSGYTVLNVPYGINGTEGYIDNNWLSILGETGYIGFAFYISLFVMLFRCALRVWRKGSTPMMRGLALGYCGALAAFAFQGLFATYFEVRTIAPYIWLFGGIIVATENGVRSHFLQENGT